MVGRGATLGTREGRRPPPHACATLWTVRRHEDRRLTVPRRIGMAELETRALLLRVLPPGEREDAAAELRQALQEIEDRLDQVRDLLET